MLAYIQREKDRLRPLFFPNTVLTSIPVVNQQDIPTQILNLEQPKATSPSPVEPSSPRTPPSPKTPVPTPSPPTQFESEAEYNNHIETQLSPIKTTIAPIVLRTVATRSKKTGTEEKQV